MEDIQLIAPDIRYKDSFAEALYEGLDAEPAEPVDILLARHDFHAYMAKRQDLSRPVVLPGGIHIRRVPQIDLWLVKGDTFIGRSSLRPKLNSALKKRGGNLGYAIRSSERCKGYGRLILELTLLRAKELGLEKILITCHDENLGSIRIIESAGGVLAEQGLEFRAHGHALGLRIAQGTLPASLLLYNALLLIKTVFTRCQVAHKDV